MSSTFFFVVLAAVLACVSGFAVQPVAAARTAVTCAMPTVSSQSVFMGRGDKRTKKGKIKAGSYGNARPHKAPEKVRLLKPASYEALNPK